MQGLEVQPQTILDVAGAVPQSVLAGLLAACRSGIFASVQTAISDAIADGYPVSAACSMLGVAVQVLPEPIDASVSGSTCYNCCPRAYFEALHQVGCKQRPRHDASAACLPGISAQALVKERELIMLLWGCRHKPC